ncbi:MAG: hypothetical protein QM396_03625 [Euryarchaeota archaeon]|jgi:hypothetical protein|uniref:ARPP-1 family domain-containing protein n=1 Tax=Methanobacterium sp. MZD130B TaxID=3394378 RepID=UPI0039FBFC64|nr:hypothetical protein [Euryarchaeota archaeon]
MDEVLANYIYEMDLGDIQEHKGMSVFPLYTKGDDSDYITLKEALDADLIKITEIDEMGSVPELKVINKANVPVLLLDGEELAGAKQNRVLNTTILLKQNSETVIPVSCTEQGRWSYTSLKFSDSGNVASYRVRRYKSASVNKSLKTEGKYRSDQRMVWNAIDDVSREARVMSNTRAMRDVYESRDESLQDYHHAFPLSDGQKGILVMVNGEVMGLDVLSSSIAYSVLHPKLLKSYSLEAILQEEKNDKADEEDQFNGLDQAKKFLDDARLSMEEKHKSIGFGCDHRLEGPNLVGSALTHKEKVIHVAFFRTMDSQNEKMSSYQTRRGFRI